MCRSGVTLGQHSQIMAMGEKDSRNPSWIRASRIFEKEQTPRQSRMMIN